MFALCTNELVQYQVYADSAFRIFENESTVLVSIPVQPISYGDATQLMTSVLDRALCIAQN